MTARRPSGAVVTGIGVVSPQARTPAEVPVVAARPRAAEGWFDARAEVGRGHKYLPPSGQFLLAAAGRALAGDPGWTGAAPAEGKGVVVGTNGGVSSLHDSIDRTVVEADADELSPATAPFFSINLLSSYLSAQHGLKAFNVTLTTPRTAALEAIELGTRALAVGRCRSFLAGATEAPLAPIESDDSGEAGAAVLLLERADAAVARDATVFGSCQVRTAFLPPRLAAGPGGRAAAEGTLEDAVAGLGGGGGPVIAHVMADDSPVGAAVADAVRRLASAGPGPVPEPAPPTGAGCLEPLMQVARLLATGDRPMLTVTAAVTGHVAVAHLSPGPPATPVVATRAVAAANLGRYPC